MSISIFSTEHACTIQVEGYFNYKINSQFRKAYESVHKDIQFIIDFQKTHTIDFSTIGMLLLLHDHIGGHHAPKKVHLINCSDHIHDVFDTLKLHKFFQISASRDYYISS